jgi:hypothetical protein
VSDITERLRKIDGFGWRCGKPLRDKGSYFRCSCGCSVPGPDCENGFDIARPEILNEAVNEIERLRAERDMLRREVCRHRAAVIQDKKPEDIAAQLQWDCFRESPLDRLAQMDEENGL